MYAEPTIEIIYAKENPDYAIAASRLLLICPVYYAESRFTLKNIPSFWPSWTIIKLRMIERIITMNDLMNLIALIIVFGVCMYLVNAFIPMPGQIKSLLNILVLIVLVIYILQFFGIIKTILPIVRILR